MTLMKEKKVRRLPITEQGRLVGIISRADVLRALFVPEFASYWLEWGQEPLSVDF
jgi:CBS domain-containing protein